MRIPELSLPQQKMLGYDFLPILAATQLFFTS